MFQSDVKLLSELPDPAPQLRTLLIVKTDDIGDYILFRDFLRVIREHYKGYKITLIGNRVWRTLAEGLDKEYIDNFIWLNKPDFMKNKEYRFEILKQIRSSGFEEVICPSYSRNLFLEDVISAAAGAKRTVGIDGNSKNTFQWQDQQSRKYYSELIKVESGQFEFFLNKDFFEAMFRKGVDCYKPTIALKPWNAFKKRFGNYIVLFPGASVKSKKWNLQYFKEVGEFLAKTYDLHIIVAGGPYEILLGDQICSHFKYKNKITDMTGKTSLMQLCELIQDSILLITNDTCSIHMAGALNVDAIVLANGNNYGRFLPYPEEISTKIKTIYPNSFIKKLQSYGTAKMYNWKEKTDINEISITTVEKAAEAILYKYRK
ncbi:MAG TPA: glycosyltransferase family 9 protein [Cytophagaceae bacterium]